MKNFIDHKHSRLSGVTLCITGLLSISSAQAAIITFDDQTKASSYGFSAKGPGFKDKALEYFKKMYSSSRNLSVEVLSVLNGGHTIPVNTTLSFQNADSDSHPTHMDYPAGSIAWSVDSKGTANPTYKFDIFAGGKLWYPNENSYKVILKVDAKTYPAVKTNTASDWKPTSFSHVPFHQNSKVTISFVPL